MEICNPTQVNNMSAPTTKERSVKGAGSFANRLNSAMNASFSAKGAKFGTLLGKWQNWEKQNDHGGSSKSVTAAGSSSGSSSCCSNNVVSAVVEKAGQYRGMECDHSDNSYDESESESDRGGGVKPMDFTKPAYNKNAESVRSSIASLNSSVAQSDMMSMRKSFSRTVCSVLSEESMTSYTLSPDDFDEVYEIGEELGSGAFAVVHEALHKKTSKSYAVKMIQREHQKESDLEAIKLEISIMTEMNHPHIVRLIDTYDEPDYMYIVMEKVVGGELLDRLAHKEYYNEKEARDACVILFHTLDYCHRRRVAHRDLKPENLLLESLDDDSKLKIADFGLAKKVPRKGHLKTLCGTPNYVAPEVIRREPYDWQCDVWSLGVIVYILLGGYSPFDEPDQKTLFRRIIHADFAFHPKYWSEVSEDAKDFIEALLHVDPKKRLTCSQAMVHKWMRIDDSVLAAQNLDSTVKELKKYNAKRKFRAAVKTLIAVNRLSCLESVVEERH